MRSIFSWLKPEPVDLLSPSVITLVLINLLPLFGVFVLDWKVFPILFLYWSENVVIGIFNVCKMLMADPGSKSGWLTKVFMVPFFCFHYGMFTMVHGIFVIGFFGGFFGSGESFPDITAVFQTLGEYQIGWAFLALLASHGVSMGINYIGKQEYKVVKVTELMMQPYGRVILLHITIVLGGFLVAFLGSPALVLVVLILLKIFIDVVSHVREHKKSRQKMDSIISSKLPEVDRPEQG